MSFAKATEKAVNNVLPTGFNVPKQSFHGGSPPNIIISSIHHDPQGLIRPRR